MALDRDDRVLPSLAARGLAAARAVGCSPAEAVALALLATGALALLGVLWSLAGPRGEHEAATPTVDASDGDDAVVDVTAAEIVVHVAGAVQRPGLYRLPGGARVAEAIQAAGGPLPDAALDHVNLARVVSDGEQLRVPGPDDLVAPETAAGGEAKPPVPTAWHPDGTLDLNLATAADLEQLPGIGPVLAERIVEHRETIGGFSAVGDLRDVAGIGEKKFQQIAPLVTV